jgi:hypothetical protein
MRIAVIGGVVLASLMAAVGATVSWPSVGFAQRVASGAMGASNLITIPTPAGEGRQQITVIDPELRSMSVYHIELASGEITLKSVRKIHWDLQMTDFNGTSPLPQDVRSLLEQK